MILSQVSKAWDWAAYGAAFYAGSRWYVQEDGRMRRMTESRWGGGESLQIGFTPVCDCVHLGAA